MDSPPSSWYDPPTGHELCACVDCHDSGEHSTNELEWAQIGCQLCEELLDMIPDLKEEV